MVVLFIALYLFTGEGILAAAICMTATMAVGALIASIIAGRMLSVPMHRIGRAVLGPAAAATIVVPIGVARHDAVADGLVLGDGKTMAWWKRDGEAGGGPGSHSRTARASATWRTAASSAGVNGLGTSLSTSICPRIVAPRRISTTSSERVSRLQAR